MAERYKEIWKQYKKKIRAVAAGLLTVLFLVSLIVGAVKSQEVFNPDKYKDQRDKRDNAIEYDTSVFGTDKNNDDGLEMDEKSEEEQALDNGDENILDKQDERNQQGVQLAENGDAGTGSNNGTALGTTNDGTGPVVNGSGDSGTGSGSGNDSGGSGSGGNGNGGGSGTGEEENPETPDPDADKYGTDYNTPELVESTYPSAGEDEKKGITVKKLQIESGSLLQHFFEGEAPRSEEMSKYISVSAVMSDGSIRKNLKYKPSEAVGGDYSVSWEANQSEETNSIGYLKVGSESSRGNYTATLTYRGKTMNVPYDIVHWKVTLNDFDESSQESADGYSQFFQELSPEDTPVIDLFNSMQDMYNLVGQRTDSNMWEGTNYEHVNVTEEIDTIWGYPTSYCVEYFGGWADIANVDNKESTGETYKIPRPSAGEITADGVYNVELYPKWTAMDPDSEYLVALNGFVGQVWYTTLLSYTGTDETLTVPQGVNKVIVTDMYYFAMDTGADLENTTIKKIVLPSSTDYYENGMGTSYVNYFPNLEEIEASVDNQSYLSIDGVLYDKLGKNLVSVPAAKKEITKWSKNVNAISGEAFQYVKMDKVDVPASVEICAGDSFFNASIGTLTLNCTGNLKLGIAAFDSDLRDEDWNQLPGLQKIVIKAEKLSWATASSTCNLFETLNQNAVDLKELGVQIIVPDSENNADYLSFLQKLQQGIDVFSGDLNSTFSILKTEKNAEENYACEDGYLLTKDRKSLIFASSLLQGDCKLPETVEKICSHAFAGCGQIASLRIPEGVKKIEDHAFSGAAGLKMMSMVGEEPATIGEKIFGNSLPVAGFVIYVSERSYDAYLTEGRKMLDKDYGDSTADKLFAVLDGVEDSFVNDGSIYFENEDGTYKLYKASGAINGVFTPMAGTEEFMEGCFANCPYLDGILLPDTMKRLDGKLFAEGTTLRVIASNAEAAPTFEADAFEGADCSEAHLILPNLTGVSDSYIENGWTGYAQTHQTDTRYRSDDVSDGNTAVYGEQEDGSLNLVYAMIDSDSVYSLLDNTTKISPYAFYGCENLVGVGNARSLTEIGESAFENCTSMTGIELANYTGESMLVGKAAFKGCSSLQSLSESTTGDTTMRIPYCMTDIPEECFADCTAINELWFSEEVTSLGRAAFRGCTELTTVYSQEGFSTYYYLLPVQITEVPEECFADCTSLVGAAFWPNIMSLGKDAYRNCSSMEEVEINRMYDFQSAFGDNDSFERLMLGTDFYEDTVTTDSLATFDSVSSFENDGHIGTLSGSFATWENLEMFLSMGAYSGWEATIDNLGAGLFENCPVLEMVTIGDIQTVGDRCFANCAKIEKINFYSQEGIDVLFGENCFEGCIEGLEVYVNDEQCQN